MNYSFLQSISNFSGQIMKGLGNTIYISIWAIVIGTVVGILIGFILTYGPKWLQAPFRGYVDIMRGLPVLVTIFIVYYFADMLLRMLFGVKLTQNASGIAALSFFACAQMAEIVRGALQSIPKGQIEAGRAIGLTFPQIFMDILLPQAIIQMIPPWINSATEMIKASTLLGMIGITELLLVTRQMVAKYNHALSYYLFIGLFYFLLNTIIEYLGLYLSTKVDYMKKARR